MKYGYVRVSTEEQNDERQFEALKKYDIEKYFTEKVSAKDMERPELIQMLKEVRAGDTIYIKDFSRIARSTKDLLDIVEDLWKRKVNLVSIKESIDSSTPTGKLMLTMIGAIYEFERNNMLERQREGIVIAKKEGKYKGRKKIEYPSNWEKTYKLWKNRDITGAAAMQIMKLKRNTFYKLIKEYESQ